METNPKDHQSVTIRKKEAYGLVSVLSSPSGSLLKLGLIAASSALAGGLAASWWYRRTLEKLQNPILSAEIQVAESQNVDRDEEDL